MYRTRARSTRSWRCRGHRAEQARAALPGPLSGVPFTVKDNIAVAGWPLVAGDPGARDAVARRPTPTRRRRAAARGGRDPRSARRTVPVRRRDRDRQRGLRAHEQPVRPRAYAGRVQRRRGGRDRRGRSAFGLGTDSGASVRLPAHFCGLAALKPTAGRVPSRRHRRPRAARALRDPRTQVGTLARSVADVALVLSVIAGPDGRDGGVAPVALRRPVWCAGCAWRCSPTTARAARRRHARVLVARAADGARATRARVVEAAAPPGGGHALTTRSGRSYGDGAISYDLLAAGTPTARRCCASASASTCILSPVFPTPAPPHGEIENLTELHHAALLTGWPAATVRCGTSADGLPIGVQVAAHPWRDDMALAAALALEARARRLLRAMTLPAGPTSPPAVQTARWLARPIAFMEACRRRYGDAFSVKFTGLQDAAGDALLARGDPGAVRRARARPAAGAHGHAAAAGRRRARCCCWRAPTTCRAARRCCRRSTATACARTSRSCVEAAERELDGWPVGAPFAVHPSMQAITLEVILRAVFGVSERGPLHDLLRDLLAATISTRAAGRRCCSAAASRSSGCRRWRRRSTRGCWPRSPRGARRAGRGHLLAARAGALRGRLGDERPRGPRPADDAAARRARDDRHRAGLDARPADAPPGRAGADARPAATPTCARSSPSRCGCARSCRSPGRRLAVDLGRRRGVAAGRDRRHARDLARPHPPGGLPGPVRLPARALPRAARPRPTPGSRTAAACAAASARRSPRWRCGSCSARSCAASTCAPASRRAERVARRNVTFSPRHGTRVIATRR